MSRTLLRGLGLFLRWLSVPAILSLLRLRFGTRPLSVHVHSISFLRFRLGFRRFLGFEDFLFLGWLLIHIHRVVRFPRFRFRLRFRYRLFLFLFLLILTFSVAASSFGLFLDWFLHSLCFFFFFFSFLLFLFLFCFPFPLFLGFSLLDFLSERPVTARVGSCFRAFVRRVVVTGRAGIRLGGLEIVYRQFSIYQWNRILHPDKLTIFLAVVVIQSDLGFGLCRAVIRTEHAMHVFVVVVSCGSS